MLKKSDLAMKKNQQVWEKLNVEKYTFSEFKKTYNLKNKVTSNIKLQEVLNNVRLHLKLYTTEFIFATKSSIVNIQPKRGTHWLLFVHKYFFVSYFCAHPNILGYSKSKHGKCIYSEYQIQKELPFVDVLVLLFFIYLFFSNGF